jgi:hypothetical protein
MENPGEGCKKGLGKSRGRVKKTVIKAIFQGYLSMNS